jgi:hypothetical protein
MQRVVSVRAGDTLTFTVNRGDATLQLKGTPELREVKDPFGNTQRLGILGITRATSPGEVTTEKVDPASALWLGIKETWFVIDPWTDSPASSGGGAVDFDRTAKSVPGAIARWRSPFVLHG